MTEPTPIEQILAIPGNALAVARLAEQLNSGAPVTFAVGEGLGIRHGVKPIRQFLQELQRVGQSTAPDKSLTLSEAFGEPDLLRLTEAVGPLYFHDSLEAAYGSAQTFRPGIKDPLKLLPCLCPARYVTVALDYVLESVLLSQLTALVRWYPSIDTEGPAPDWVLLRALGNPEEPATCFPAGITMKWPSRELREVPDAKDAPELARARFMAALHAAISDAAMHSTFVLFDFEGTLNVSWFSGLLRDSRRTHFAVVPVAPAVDLEADRVALSRHSIRPVFLPDPGPKYLDALLRHLHGQLKSPRRLTLPGPEATTPPEAPTPVASSRPEAEAGTDEPALNLPPPIPPAELIEAVRRGDCVVFTGFGMAARAGLPIWGDLMSGLLEEAVRQGRLTDEQARPHRGALRQGEIEPVADYLAEAVGTEFSAAYFQKIQMCGRDLPPSHLKLSQLRLAGAITFSYDDLVERALADQGAIARTPSDADQLKEALALKKPFVMYLNGTPARPESIFLSPAEYQTKTARYLTYRQFLEGVSYSKTFLYLGASLDTILGFVRDFPVGNRTHYALVAVAGTAWQSKTETLRRRYNVEVIPYTPTEGHEAVDNFLDDLISQTGASTRGAPPVPEGSPGVVIQRIVIENLGPFERLELPLERPWKVLLGDNGVGKSSILKALAVGLAGQAAMSYAVNLIRAGQNSARITLITAKNPSGYVTELIRQETPIPLVKSVTARLLDAEPVLALGFPPLRIVDDRAATGPQSMGQIRPTADDVLPLLQRAADPRTDQLKQWIVNLDDLARREPDRPWPQVLDRFFKIATDLTFGVDVGRGRVTEHFEVMVKSGGVELPLSALSQGTTSLLSWVGLLVQRLYQINGFAGDALSQPALVLMDEIDAHMHPEWQQGLVYKLKQLFPAVQFIASTHSALIVGGMEPAEVTRFVRKNGRVEMLEVTLDMLRGRADQILTGQLFGLGTTLDYETQQLVREYLDLLGNPQRTETEEQRRRELARRLEGRIPATPEKPMHHVARDLSLRVLETAAMLKLGKPIADGDRKELGRLAARLAELTEERPAR